MNIRKSIYADNAATTPLDPAALEAMLPFLQDFYANPSSLYSICRPVKKALQEARETIAECIGALPDEIFFTSGGSESDNWAIKNFVFSASLSKRQILTSPIEHHAILNSCTEAANYWGFTIVKTPVDQWGVIDVDEYLQNITKHTAGISIMLANNEVGTIEDIKKKYMERGKGLIPEDLMQDFDFDVSFFVGMNYDLDRESERQVRAFDLALDLLEELKKGTSIEDVCKMCEGNSIFLRRNLERIVADTLAKYSDRGKDFVKSWETEKYGEMISYYPEYKSSNESSSDDRQILEEQLLSRLDDKRALEDELALVDKELDALETEAKGIEDKKEKSEEDRQGEEK